MLDAGAVAPEERAASNYALGRMRRRTAADTRLLDMHRVRRVFASTAARYSRDAPPVELKFLRPQRATPTLPLARKPISRAGYVPKSSTSQVFPPLRLIFAAEMNVPSPLPLRLR